MDPKRGGDGVIVVPEYREGSQDSVSNMTRTGKVQTTLHSCPLLIARKLRDRLSYNYSSTELRRGVSSKPLTQIDIYKKAYDIIKSKAGNMTAGSDRLTLDEMSTVKLNKLMKSVMSWEYQCKPVRRVYKAKPNGKMRPQAIPCINDKILQTACKLIIEPECERLFHKNSFAFRPNKSVHHALLAVRGMVGITWMIEGDIKGYFDNIDHQILNKIIEKRLDPDRTLKGLFNKFMKAGYMEDWKFVHSILGVPHFVGGIISPILSNLYLTPFDEFMDEIKNKHEVLAVSTINKEYRKIEARIWTLKLHRWKIKNVDTLEKSRVIEELKALNTRLRKWPSRCRTASKIHYVRYADDWVIGVIGSKKLALQIRDEIYNYLKSELKLELSMEKTKISHLGSDYALFLGHYINVKSALLESSTRKKILEDRKRIVSKSTGKPKLTVPIKDLKEKLIKRDFADSKGKAKSVGKFLFLSDYEIVNRFNSVLRGIMNFYNMAENRSHLAETVHILEYSLAHTLAAKHRMSLAKVFRKYGKPVKVTISKDKKIKEVKFDKPDSLAAVYLDTKYAKYSSPNEFKDPFTTMNLDIKQVNIQDQPCLICESKENVEIKTP